MASIKASVLLLAMSEAVALTGVSAIAMGAAAADLQQPSPIKPTPDDTDALPKLPAPAVKNFGSQGKEISVALKGLQIEGNKAISTPELLSRIKPFVAGSYRMSEMGQLAQSVVDVYRLSGYPFVQAILPPQSIQDGILKIQVLEGVFGSLQIVTDDPKARDAQRFLVRGLRSGDIIEDKALERTMLLLDDQPGFKVRPVMKPGADQGEGDLFVDVDRKNYVSGELGLDNTGNESTGRNRARASININSPFRFGDLLAINAMYTDKKLWLGSIDYELPLNASGLRGRIGFSKTSYQLAGSFASLGAHGTADTTSAKLQYPLIRSQLSNLTASAEYQHKALQDDFDAVGSHKNKSSDLLITALQFDRKDTWLGGGVSYGQASVTLGNLHLDQESRPLDAATAQTAGQFAKFNLDIARIQKLPDIFSLYGRVSMQVASKNLDSSEKYGIGGFLGIRAYPMGEDSGDTGWLSQFELRMDPGPATLFLFADNGRMRINKNPWDQNSSGSRTLAGFGFGLRMTRGNWGLESTVATRTQGGPPQSESADRNPRWYGLVTYRFN